MSGFLIHHPAPNATTCIVVGPLSNLRELDLNRYRAVLLWLDANSLSLAPDARDRRVQIAILGKDDIAQTLERFIRLNPRQLPSLIVSKAIEGRVTESYKSVITEIHRQLESAHRTRLTRQQDGFTWQKHVLQNASDYVRHRLPFSWAGALSGCPAFVCGAGPSLDVSIAKLAGAADHAVIFAADSALRALARQNVNADFAISIDVAKIPSKCLPDNVRPARTILASISPPAWQNTIPEDQRFYLSGNQLTDDWFAQQGVPRTAIAVSESCGSTAIELAHFLGCSPIYLFGLDLAVDPANQKQRHHKDADSTLYRNSKYDPTAQLPHVPGNYSDTVPCFAFGDWQELDARLANRKETQIFNVNDRGARLRGTMLVHPDHFAIEAPVTTKRQQLANLTQSTRSTAPECETALARMRSVGEQGHRALPRLQQALATGGAEGLAEAFRPLLLDPAIGRALGAFALKLMPHLVPPIEGDRAFWESLLSEFTVLTELARTAGR